MGGLVGSVVPGLGTLIGGAVGGYLGRRALRRVEELGYGRRRQEIVDLEAASASW